MKLLRFIGLGLAAAGTATAVAFVARLFRRSSRCPDCEGTLHVDSFEIVGEEPELSSYAVATCGECGLTVASVDGDPWTIEDRHM